MALMPTKISLWRVTLARLTPGANPTIQRGFAQELNVSIELLQAADWHAHNAIVLPGHEETAARGGAGAG